MERRTNGTSLLKAITENRVLIDQSLTTLAHNGDKNRQNNVKGVEQFQLAV